MIIIYSIFHLCKTYFWGFSLCFISPFSHFPNICTVAGGESSSDWHFSSTFWERELAGIKPCFPYGRLEILHRKGIVSSFLKPEVSAWTNSRLNAKPPVEHSPASSAEQSKWIEVPCALVASYQQYMLLVTHLR